ncbi:MAG TPA: acyl-ACP--UDP-N-acetylglucosamine O-acyltransferase [Candidatus Dormibacteraeota bacterium]|nr:acyl-ACP--UDP-N-acetylglucosamine O-acyltransferase [Candidatus Dormibacteraeota bacterium]
MPIHPTAIVDPRAEIDPTADIGPYVIVDGPVLVGAGTRVLAHAVLVGDTAIGRDNVIHYGAVIGNVPQDLSYRDAPTGVRIGDRNIIREHAEVHRATALEHPTELGDDNFLFARAHVAHDCRVGNGVIVASGAMLAGHVTVGDRANISGNCVVHQYVRIGRLALLRGGSRTSRDVPPFAIMDWTHTVRAINRVGLRRAGFSAERIRALQAAFATLFRTRRNLRLALAEVEAAPMSDDVAELVTFIRAATRGVCFGPRHGTGEDAD